MDNNCVCCGDVIPEGSQVCRFCENEGAHFAKMMENKHKADKAEEFEVDDRLEQAYRQGYEAGTRDSDRIRELLGKAMKLVSKSCTNCDVKMLSDKCKGRANPNTCFRWKYYEEAERLINKAAEKR